MDQTVITQACIRGNVGGIRDATRELGQRSPRCFIKQFGNKISQCFQWHPVPSVSLTCISFFSLSPCSLHGQGLDSHREQDFTQLCATATSESKFRCQAQSITLRYQISIYNWQLNFSVQQSLIQRSTFWEVRLQI